MSKGQYGFVVAVLSMFVFNACTPDSPIPLSSEKNIQSFVFTKVDNAGLTADVAGIVLSDTIKVVFPSGTLLTNLKPAITFAGKTISPASGVGHNFSNPVIYTVTAQDGSTANYVVSARILADSAKSITSFVFRTTENPGLSSNVSGTVRNDSVLTEVPFGTNITNLKPFISITGINISPASLSPHNFTNTVSYVVTAEDGSTRSYTAVVTIEVLQATLYINSLKSTPTANGYLYSIDANTGVIKWSKQIGIGSHSTMPFSNGVLFTGLQNGIAAVDTVTRTFKWQYTTGGFVESSPTVVNGVVYANCSDRYLYAIDEITGTLLWRFAEKPPVAGETPVSDSSPTVDNGTVYFGSDDNYIYAVDAVTGALKWKILNNFVYPNGINIRSNPCVVNNTVYVTDIDWNLLALNANDGSLRWKYQTDGGNQNSSPTIVNGILYFISSGNTLRALDANTGTVIWTYVGAYGPCSPIVANGIVYFIQSYELRAVDATTGTLRWSYHSPDEFKSSPVVFNQTVYVGAYSSVVAFDANTGALKWRRVTNSGFEDPYSSPTIIDKLGNIYYSTESGLKN